MPARSRALSLAAVAALVVVGITCSEPTAPKNRTRPAGIVNPGNTPPVASAGGPYTGVEGAPVAFDASGTTDADLPGDPLLYKWDFDNDGVYDDSSTTPTISHTYPDNGSFTAKLTVVDDGPDSSSVTAAVTVDNAAPVVDAGGNGSTTEGASFTLGGSFTDAGTADGPWAYTVDWGDGSATTTGNAASQGAIAGLTHVYADEGTGSYTATLTVTDNDGTQSTGSATITVANAAPVVVPMGPTTITTGTLYELSGTVTDQGANDGPWAYVIDWGDGTPNTTGSLTNLADGLSASHTFTTDGTHSIRVTVTDADGAAGFDSTLTIASSLPLVADAGSGYTGTEGSAIAFDGSNSNDPDGDPLTLTWDFGDGTPTQTGATPTHTYRDNGTYTVTLTVDDGEGHTNTATATATVSNALPIVNAGADASIDEGQSFTLNGSFTDAGTADNPWTYAINWGDGSPNTTGSSATQAAISATHQYNTPGSYTVTLTVTDKNSGGSSDDLALTVRAVKPTARPGGPYTGTEGAAVAFDGSTSSDPNSDPLTYTWVWGDGTANGTGATPSHTYAQNGTYTVQLTVDDGNGHTSAVASTTATISNALPVVNAGADATIDERTSFSLNASFADAGAADNPWAYAINWGDGTPNTTGSRTTQGAIPAITHLYNTPGTYNVTVTVTDKDGGGSSDVLVLTVRAVWPTARQGSATYTAFEGAAVAFDGSTSSDPNGDPLTYTWVWGDGTPNGSGATPSHTYVQNGSYTASLTVSDNNGHTSAPATAAVTINNAVPVVNAGVNATIDERSTFTLNGSFTDAGTSDNPWATTIVWGDGTPNTTGSLAAQGAVTGTHTYNTPGTYTLTLSVRDKDNGTGSASITVTVRAVWPIARHGGPYTGREGAPVAFNGTTSSDPNGDALTYAWDFDNNGTTDATTATPSHTYADNGTYTVKLTVSDGNGHSSSATTTATIGNAAPVVNAGADAGVDETPQSTSFTLNATFSDSGVVDNPWSYTIDWGNGTTTGSKTTQGAITATRAYAAVGTYTVKVTVTDKNGTSGTDTMILTVRGLWPTANIGGPYSGREGVPLAFNASGSTDPNGDPLTYAWTFGDGTTGTGVAPSHTYADNGSYTARLIVTDPGGHADTATATVTIVATVGVVSAGPDGTVSAGGSFTFNGSFTDGAADGPWTYEIAWGDGTTTFGVADAPGAITASHRYGAAGSFTVTLTLTDKDGGSASDVALVTVTSAAAPVANVNGPYTGNEGTAILFSSAGSTDPNGEALTYAWTFGDGTTSAAANPSKTYIDNGTYTVILKVTSRSGLAAWDTTQATVANVAPTASFGAPSSVVEGSGYTLTLSGTDKGTTDRATLQYAFDCGQGAGMTGFSQTVKSVTCPVVPDQRTGLTVRGQVQDKDGGLTTYTKTFNVTNAAPVVAWAATSPTTVAPNATVSFSGSFTDKGVNDATWTYTIIWGDGTPNSTGTTTTPITAAAPLAVSHVYAKPGNWLAYMTVKDKDAATGTSAKITVKVANTPPVANANGPYAGAEGTSIQFSSAGSSDPESQPLTYAWTFGDGTTSSSANPLKSFPDDRTYSVRLIVKDPTGAADTSTTTATTTNVAPTATLSVPATTEGTAYTLTVTGTDAGTADRTTLQYDMDCGQGAGWRGYSTTKTHTCPAVPDQRSLTLQYRVKDDEGAVTSYTKAFSITNAVPVVTFAATTPTSFQVGGSLGVQGSFTDKGVNDTPWTYTIVWGDGTANSTGSASPGTAIVASHPYAKTGTFGVTLSVRDKDGGTKVSTKITVTVSP